MSIQELLWKFLNSQLGLLVSSFFLITLAGTFLTTWYKRESKKHEVRFVQLHEERAKAIKTFHDKAIEFNKLLEFFRDGLLLEHSEELYNKSHEFRLLAEEYKIFFNKELCSLIDEITSLWGDLSEYASMHDAESFNENSGGEVAKALLKLNSLIESLRQEFRNILGVE